VGTNDVGYLPSEMAENYAEPLLKLVKLNRLVTGQARMWALDEGGIVRARVTILVPEPAALSGCASCLRAEKDAPLRSVDARHLQAFATGCRAAFLG
jgi:hypothetical protein